MTMQTLEDAVLSEFSMSSRAGDPWPESPWGVYVGSHGGRGETVADAMLSCLRCCSEPDECDDEPNAGIGEWWKVVTIYCDSEHEGKLLRDRFNELAIEHLGSPLWVGTWLPADHPLACKVYA